MSEQDEEKLLKRFAKSKERIEAAASDDTFWKRRLADAVLDLLREGAPITAATLKAHLAANEGKPIVIRGTGMEIEFSRKASQAAIAHLDEIAGPPKGEMD